MSNLEFDIGYSAITGEHVPGLYPPHAEADTALDVDGCDVLLDGLPDNLSEWGQITGKTGQYGYRGAIMHPSENPTDDQIREWVREAGGDVFALVVVESPCDPCFPDDPDHCVLYGCDATPAGWAIIYREAA